MKKRVVAAPADVDATALTLPLLAGADRARLDLVRVATWDDAARGLESRSFDAALVSPMAALALPAEFELIPRVGLACRGASGHMLLQMFSRLEQIETVGSSARGHVAEIVARRAFSISSRNPAFVPFDGDVDDGLGEVDAVLVTGNQALSDETPEEATTLDLGEAWSVMTGMPLVWGVWAARVGMLDDVLFAALQADDGRDRPALIELAATFAEEQGCARPPVEALLVSTVSYRLGDEELAGLEELWNVSAELGLESRGTRPRWRAR